MTSVYAWTEDEDEIALDAVTVGIRSDTRILTVAGIQFGQRDAIVYWPETSIEGAMVPAAVEGPMPVEEALKLAERLRSDRDLKRVVVYLQHRALWDERWGSLQDDPGL